MSTLKKWMWYIIAIIAFWIFSDFLINVGLSSSYKDMVSKTNDNNSNIVITDASSTLINGRIQGFIKDPNKDLDGKYLKIDLYNADGKIMGEQFQKIENVQENEPYPININFQVENVKGYGLDIVDKMQYKDQIPKFQLFDKQLSNPNLLLGLVIFLAMGVFG